MKLTIEAGKASSHYWSDLWRYRELFLLLAWRDLLVRYKQTLVGVAWAVLRPLFTMLVLTVVFGKLAKLPSDGVPYPILVFAALLPWQFFATAFAESGNSLISNASMLSKVYFPRVALPTSTLLSCLVDLIISLGILALVMIWYRFLPPGRVFFLPFFILMASGLSLGAGLWVAALNVKYRDFRYIIPFIVQFGLYISPVGFSSEVVPEKWRLLYSVNPMVGVIDGFRWAILGDEAQLYLPGFLLSLVMIVLIFGLGFSYFRRTEQRFADVI